MKQVTWTLLGALLASLAINVVQATDGHGSDGPPVDGAAVVDELCLTEQQCSLLRDACISSGDNRDQIGRDLEAKGKELIDVVTFRGGIDEVRAAAIADELGRLQSEFLKNRIRAIKRVREALTDEQMDILRAAISR